jgi:hypothetical protein
VTIGATIPGVSTEGWIFMVGFRVFDVGLLVAWLVWFFRLRDDGDDPADDDDQGGGGPDRGHDPGSGPSGKGARLPARWRVRDHARPRFRAGERRPAPERAPVPSRVRLPAVPHPARRRIPSGAPSESYL